jgi:glycosyltransferase involved in cell wall biosynthesis
LLLTLAFVIFKKKKNSKKKNELKLVFLSRISPKKNLIYALNLLKEIDNFSLDIYGSIEEINYWERCLSIINDNNLNVNYKGELKPEDVTSVLSDYHFFILPTLNENYGHVIVEALTAGCGLIISDNTPWRELKKKGIGWDISLTDKEKFIQTLRYCIAMEQDEYNTIRNNCYNFVEKEINTTKEIEDTKKLFS